MGDLLLQEKHLLEGIFCLGETVEIICVESMSSSQPPTQLLGLYMDSQIFTMDYATENGSINLSGT